MKKFIVVVLLALCSQFIYAHGGEDHSEPKAKQSAGKNYFTINSVSDAFELVLRYEPIEIGLMTKMKLFVSEFETNKPVDSAKIEITCAENDQLKFKVIILEKGIYQIEGQFPENKKYTLIANIIAEDNADLMTLVGVEVGRKLETAAEEIKPGSTWLSYLWIGISFVIGVLITLVMTRKKRFNQKSISIFLTALMFSITLNNSTTLYAHGGEEGAQKGQSGNTTDEVEIQKETQFLFNIETGLSASTDYYSTVKLYGRIMPATNKSAQIISPQNAIIVSLNVSIGQTVGKDQILAVLEQTLSGTEQLQLATEKSNTDAEYQNAKKDYERLKSIQDVIAKKDFQQAEIRFKTAEINKKIYDNLSSNNSKLITIKSPLAGKVDNFNLAIGQQVIQSEVLFGIYDVSKLKVEALVYDKDVNKIAPDAGFIVEGIQLNTNSEKATMITFSNVINTVNQSSQLILEIENANGDFRPGQFVYVNVMVKKTEKQVVIPTSAVSEINGKPAVFIHHDPEIFKVMYVQLGESNNESTVIVSGLNEKELVVKKGAYQVKSIFMNQ